MLRQKALPNCLVKQIWRHERFSSVTTNKRSRSDHSSFPDLHINKGSVTGLLKVTEFNTALFSVLILHHYLSKTSQKSSLECYSTKTYFTEVFFKEFILSWRMFCLLGVSAVLLLFSSCTMLLVEQRACGTPLIAPHSNVAASQVPNWQICKKMCSSVINLPVPAV